MRFVRQSAGIPSLHSRRDIHTARCSRIPNRQALGLGAVQRFADFFAAIVTHHSKHCGQKLLASLCEYLLLGCNLPSTSCLLLSHLYPLFLKACDTVTSISCCAPRHLLFWDTFSPVTSRYLNSTTFLPTSVTTGLVREPRIFCHLVNIVLSTLYV